MPRFLLSFLAVFALAVQVQAQSLPDWVSPHLNDFAGVIDVETAAQITAELQAADTDPGVEIAVVTLRRRADHAPGSTLEGFAKDLFNHWGVGDATRDDGILIVVLVEDREMRIALGSAYPVVYDGRAQRVIDTMMLPEFRNGNYGAGILAGVIGAREHIARPLVEGRPVTEDSGLPAKPGGGVPWDLVALFSTMLAILGFKMRRVIGDIVVRRRPCPACGARGIQIERTTTQEPGETTKGEERTRHRCPSCDWHRDRMRPVPSLSEQRASSSRSGMGGGRSSGGGASGRW